MKVQGLCEDIAGGLAGFQPADRQRVALVPSTGVERRVGVKRSCSGLRLAVIETLCLIFVAVVGIEVEVSDDLHWLIRERLKHVSLEEHVAGLFDNVKIELVGELATDGIGVW